MENASEEMHSNKNSCSISGEESARLTFGLKKNSTQTYSSSLSDSVRKLVPSE